ncbi:MAG: LytR/AlgR family response regulator transcription factor [Aureispira sp.]
MINCIIIDDERNAQKLLQHYIAKTSSLQEIAVLESALDLTPALLSKVEVLFLDMEMPAINGLDFLKTLKNPPKVIVTTAYPQYAVDAFEQAVVDYLMKPFSYDRFLQAIERVKSSWNSRSQKYLLVYANKTTHKVTIRGIQYIKSELDYVCLVMDREKIMLLGSLTNWEQKLADDDFIRVHRSYIVNIARIEKVHKATVLIEGRAIPIGKSYRTAFLKAFEAYTEELG